MTEPPHAQARHSAVCHAMAKHAPPQSDWKVESDGELSTITSEQMRQAMGDTEHPMGLTFSEDEKDLHIKAVEIPEQMRGMGIGTQLYIQALQYAQDNGLGFRSDVNPTPEALSVYARLVGAGIPITQQKDEAGVLQFSIPAEALESASLEEAAQKTGDQNG